MEEVGILVETVPSVRVAFTRLIGPYEKWGLGLMALKNWLEAHHVPIAGRPIGLFFDNPLQTPAAELRSDACLPVMGSVVPEMPFDVKELPGGQAAITRHFGPVSDYTRTYGAFLEGIIRAGYSFVGPAREIFSEARADLQPGSGVRIEQLLKKMR